MTDYYCNAQSLLQRKLLKIEEEIRHAYSNTIIILVTAASSTDLEEALRLDN